MLELSPEDKHVLGTQRLISQLGGRHHRLRRGVQLGAATSLETRVRGVGLRSLHAVGRGVHLAGSSVRKREPDRFSMGLGVQSHAARRRLHDLCLL